MPQLFDMHCHLDYCDDCKQIARDVANKITAVDSTILPANFVTACEEFADFPNIHVGLGIHPWEVAEDHISKVDLDRFDHLIENAQIIGEVGLDFYKKRRESRTEQMEVLAHIFQSIKDAGGGRTIYLHSVKSYDDIFELMDRYEIANANTCVFHWFQGTPDDFGRAISMGCMFSVGMRMLATSAGRKFALAIPDDLLLAETDGPSLPGRDWDAQIWMQMLENTYKSLADVRETSCEHIESLLQLNSEKLLMKQL